MPEPEAPSFSLSGASASSRTATANGGNAEEEDPEEEEEAWWLIIARSLSAASAAAVSAAMEHPSTTRRWRCFRSFSSSPFASLSPSEEGREEEEGAGGKHRTIPASG